MIIAGIAYLNIPWLLITVLISWFIVWFIETWRKVQQLPPGPFPLPLIGNLHLLRKDIHLSMDRLSLEYGSVFTLWMANIPFVVITDTDVARQVTMSTTFTDRNGLYVGETLYTRGGKDIIMGHYGRALQMQRRLVHGSLKLFGNDMSGIEARIQKSASVLCNTFEKNAGNPNFNPSLDVELACFNVMYEIVCGERVGKTDPNFTTLQKTVFVMMQSGVTLSLMNFYPILRHFPNPELYEILKVVKERDVVLQQILERAERTFQPGAVTNYVEGLLQAKHDIELEEGQSLFRL